MLPQDTFITINFNDNGNGTYELANIPDDEAWRGKKLGWKAGSHCTKWMALLEPCSVPADKRSASSNATGEGHIKLPGAVHGQDERVKYSILAEDVTGKHHFVDPIVVLKDDNKTSPLMALENVAQELEDLAQGAQTFGAEAEQVGAATRQLVDALQAFVDHQATAPAG